MPLAGALIFNVNSPMFRLMVNTHRSQPVHQKTIVAKNAKSFCTDNRSLTPKQGWEEAFARNGGALNRIGWNRNREGQIGRNQHRNDCKNPRSDIAAMPCHSNCSLSLMSFSLNFLSSCTNFAFGVIPSSFRFTFFETLDSFNPLL